MTYQQSGPTPNDYTFFRPLRLLHYEQQWVTSVKMGRHQRTSSKTRTCKGVLLSQPKCVVMCRVLCGCEALQVGLSEEMLRKLSYVHSFTFFFSGGGYSYRGCKWSFASTEGVGRGWGIYFSEYSSIVEGQTSCENRLRWPYRQRTVGNFRASFSVKGK